MHKEILTKEQAALLPLLRACSKHFGLVGGTAIALHIGHRRSIDFDLFSNQSFKNSILRKKVHKFAKIDQIIVDRSGEFTFICAGVKLTFFHYPFVIGYRENLDNVIKFPDLLTLAAMKAHALGGRAKWKDYVDLFFIIKDFYKVHEIANKATKLFQGEFNEKLFRIQLAYFKDINYSEEVEFLPGFKVSSNEIKKALIEFSLG